jgi:hypothetical protein
MDSQKLLEALGSASSPQGGEEAPVIRAVLHVAAGREEEAREMCSARGQSDADLRYNSGKLADAIEFQEELIALVKKASEARQSTEVFIRTEITFQNLYTSMTIRAFCI